MLIVSLFLNSATHAQVKQSDEKQDIVKELSNFIEFYYQRPDPELAKTKLEQLLKSPDFKRLFKDQRSWLNQIAYFYGQVGLAYPQIRNYYMIYFDTLGFEARMFLLDVLRICGDEEVEHYLRQKYLTPEFRSERDAINQILQTPIPVEIDLTARNIRLRATMDRVFIFC